MRMIECNIMNFGTLSDFHYDFQHGINRIIRGNGFGKSTFAAFIRVMLYGFEGEGKRDTLARERKFYEPWQGGNYGGDIVFETAGKCYRLTRTFGKKADSDAFELRDMYTNLVSNDFSENIGYELFDMDSETFRRTVFVSQDGMETSVNDTISGKIGALVDNTDDLNAFEKAKSALDELILSLTPRRKTGEVSRLNDRITALEAEILPADRLDESMQSLIKMREQEEEKLYNLKKEKNDLTERAAKLGKSIEIANKKERYEALSADLNVKKTALDDCQRELPEGTDISKLPLSSIIRGKARDYMMAASSFDGSKLLELSDNEEANYIRLCDTYGDEDPVRKAYEYIERRRDLKELDNDLHETDEKLREINEKEEAAKKEQKKKSFRFGAVCVFLLLSNVIYFFIDDPIVGIADTVITLFICLAFFVWYHKNRDIIVFDEERKDILNRMENIKKERDALSSQICAFVSKYGKDSSPEMIAFSLKEIINDHEALINLKNKKERAEAASQNAHSEIDGIMRYISETIGTEPEEDPYTQLLRYADTTDRVREALKAFEEAQESLRRFKEENDINEIENSAVSIEGSLSETTARLSEVSMLADESAERLASLDRRSDELESSLEYITEKRAEKEALKEERDRKHEIYECCVIAKDRLVAAKENLSARYIRPIYEKFMYYHTKITGDQTHEYMVDANIDVSVKEYGMTHSIGQLSRGLKDVVGLSLRMAFIDVMFPEEKPVIILDDPFVNLDRVNLDAAEKLMDLIGRDYQVIYFAAREDSEPQIQI